MKVGIVLALVLVLATSAFALEKKAYQMREDFGTEPLYDCTLNYYYYIPCPTYSWFWAFALSTGDMIGVCFEIGDQGTGGWDPCDPSLCQTLEIIRILDFGGYGTLYPGLFTIEFDAYCAPEPCCGPTDPFIHLWNSGSLETGHGWNYFPVEPPLCLSRCCLGPQPPCNPSIVITATHTGSAGTYPAWGLDNISTPLEAGCIMHDIGCLPAAYPRGMCGGSYPKVHSGYLGYSYPFEYWPPLCFCDGRDTSRDCTHLGCVELAWRIYITCEGPTAARPGTWGSIKSMYR
jgi:hypothetical protein